MPFAEFSIFSQYPYVRIASSWLFALQRAASSRQCNQISEVATHIQAMTVIVNKVITFEVLYYLLGTFAN
jgi:hypothetical protein